MKKFLLVAVMIGAGSAFALEPYDYWTFENGFMLWDIE